MNIPDSRRMSRKLIAKTFGVLPSAVTQWHKRKEMSGGCPRNADGTYNLETVVVWRMAQGATRSGSTAGLAGERERLYKARADGAEINVALARGSVVPLQEVRAAVSDMIVAVRTRIMSIGQSVAPVVATMSDARLIKDFIDERNREALTELAEYSPKLDGGNDEMDMPAPKHYGKRVGRPKKKA